MKVNVHCINMSAYCVLGSGDTEVNSIGMILALSDDGQYSLI